MRRIVVDTNVVVAGLRSDLGAAFKLISLIDKSEKFGICISVPLTLEYEEVLNRPDLVPQLTSADVGKFLGFICSVAILCDIFYLWRPYLRDPKDEMVLETAVAGGCNTIVTYNHRDFGGAEKFGIQILSPKTFLQQIGELA
jgi:putative PIN family toxin of toxin-antitoxin system